MYIYIYIYTYIATIYNIQSIINMCMYRMLTTYVCVYIYIYTHICIYKHPQSLLLEHPGRLPAGELPGARLAGLVALRHRVPDDRVYSRNP